MTPTKGRKESSFSTIYNCPAFWHPHFLEAAENDLVFTVDLAIFITNSI